MLTLFMIFNAVAIVFMNIPRAIALTIAFLVLSAPIIANTRPAMIDTPANAYMPVIAVLLIETLLAIFNAEAIVFINIPRAIALTMALSVLRAPIIANTRPAMIDTPASANKPLIAVLFILLTLFMILHAVAIAIMNIEIPAAFSMAFLVSSAPSAQIIPARTTSSAIIGRIFFHRLLAPLSFPKPASSVANERSSIETAATAGSNCD